MRKAQLEGLKKAPHRGETLVISRRDGRQIIQAQRLGEQALHLADKGLEVGLGDMLIQRLLVASGLTHVEGIRHVTQLKQRVVEIAWLLAGWQQQRLQRVAQGLGLPGFRLQNRDKRNGVVAHLETLQHDFADRAPGFQLSVGFLQIGGVDGSVVLAKGGAQRVIVNQRGDAGQ